MAAVAPHHRGGRARRLPGAAGHQRAVAAVPAAPSPGVLEGPGGFLTGALRPRARSRAVAFCLHALRRGPPPLHRRDLRPLRDAHAPVQGRTPLPPHLGARQAAATRGTDQPAHPFPPAHEAGTPLLTALLTEPRLFRISSIPLPASRFLCEHLPQKLFRACISRIHAQVPVVTTGELAKTLRQQIPCGIDVAVVPTPARRAPPSPLIKPQPIDCVPACRAG